MLIGGELAVSESGEWFESIDPATESTIGRAPTATAGDVNRAVDAAIEAQKNWAERSIFERAAALKTLATAIRDRADEILQLEAQDTGNTIAKLGADIAIAAGYLEYFAGLGTEMKGESVPASAGNLHFSLRQPYGVVGRIVPFNHPFMFAVAHLAAPLMAGNAVVVKTPETSALSGGILAELCQTILPSGVVNVVSGFGLPAGDALIAHPAVRRIGFTGSVSTGLAIQRRAAEVGVKHVSLELGGKNPLIALPDADPDRIVDAAVAGMNFSWAGQSCGSTSRLLIHESLYDQVIVALEKRLPSLKLGDPRDPSSEMGPVNNDKHYRHVVSLVESGRNEGARLITGGRRPGGRGFEKGYWLEPTLFADVTDSMRITREEVFGPVLVAQPWGNRAEMVQSLNESDLGLTAAIWTNDLQAAMTTMRELETGYVWINGVAQHYVGTAFGGWKNSGAGNEESLAELLSYTRNKSVHVILEG